MNRQPLPPRKVGLARGPLNLPRRAPLARAAVRRQPAQQPRQRPDSPGWSQDTRATVQRRSGGVCEVTALGCLGRATNVHHRLPRRMGGSRNPAVHTAANLLHLCGSGTTGCHGWIEGHRTEALERGWLLHAGQDPAAEPCVVRGRLVWLTEDGRMVGERAS